MLALIELTSIIFTIWSVFTVFVKMINKTINSNVEVPSIITQSVKEIPAYVIPAPVTFTSSSEALSTIALEPLKNTTINLTPAELFNKFKAGEDLSSEQYMEIKNYLMTR